MQVILVVTVFVCVRVCVRACEELYTAWIEYITS